MSCLGRSILGAAIAMVIGSQLCAAELIVVNSSNTALRAGQVIAADGKLGLAAGQTATLISSTGRTIRVVGPADTVPAGDGVAPGDDKTVLASLTTLVKTRQAETSSLGAFRAAEAELPSPWVLDVSSSGERCVLDGEPLVLWRPDSTAAVPVIVARPAKAWRGSAQWPAGAQQLFAPDGDGLADGETLSVQLLAHHSQLNVHLVPASVQGEVMRLAWLVQANCVAQAAALVRQLE